MISTAPYSLSTPADFPALTRTRLETLQVNLGYRCNQACAHCHVDAGPQRTEAMSAETVALVLDYVREARPRVLDVTGGAPELNPFFRDLVCAARGLGLEVIDRCNLTILEEPGHHDLAEFLAAQGVHVVASLPCYGPDNVDTQRGRGVFAKSIRALRTLNSLGYGAGDSRLQLDLVYNPVGPHLPPPQQSLEATYKERLSADYGVVFNRVLTLANMPIARFRHALERDQTFIGYMRLLRENFAASNLADVMCRTLVSVDWQGYVYDCDFNQMLSLPLGASAARTHLSALIGTSVDGRAIAVAEHCFGCTAGQGSGCSGALYA